MPDTTSSELNKTPLEATGTGLTHANRWSPTGTVTIPRRAVPRSMEQFLQSAQRLQSLGSWTVGTQALLALDILLSTHPIAAAVMDFNYAVAFRPGATRVVAKQRGNAKEADAPAQAALDALWQNVIPEIGSGGDGPDHMIASIQRVLAEQIDAYGMRCIEGVLVPGGFAGVSRIQDFDPASVTIYYDKGERRVKQFSNLLDERTCFVAAWKGSRNNPMGTPRLASALAVLLSDLCDQDQVSGALEANVWPQKIVDFPWLRYLEYFTSSPAGQKMLKGAGADGADASPVEFVTGLYEASKLKAENMSSRSLIFAPEGAGYRMLQAASLGGLDEIMLKRLYRCMNSLRTPPSVMGYTDGGTQAYAADQRQLWVDILEGLRAHPNMALLQLGNLHLRSLGSDAIVTIETDPMTEPDKAAAAAVAKTEFANVMDRLSAGFIDDDTAGKALGTDGISDPEALADAKARWREGKFGTRATATTAPGDNTNAN